MWELDRWYAVHQDDWDIARADIEARRTSLNPVEVAPVGMDCARKLGLDYTRPA